MIITDLFGSWEGSYEMLPSLLAAIQNFTYDIKYIIETPHTIKFDVENCHRLA
jgi:hypothetical protein